MSSAPERSEPPLTPAAAFARRVTRRQWIPLAIVLVIAAAGLLLVWSNFRIGALMLAASVATALFIRLLRTEEDAGLLAVRAKYIDIAVLGVLAVGLIVLGLWVPLI